MSSVVDAYDRLDIEQTLYRLCALQACVLLSFKCNNICLLACEVGQQAFTLLSDVLDLVIGMPTGKV